MFFTRSALGLRFAQRTLQKAFTYFEEQPCAFIRLAEIAAGFYLVRSTTVIKENILKPWVACALVLDCMVPRDGPHKYLNGGNGDVYGERHGFDQSAWAILLYRTYGRDVYKRTQTYGGKYTELKYSG